MIKPGAHWDLLHLQAHRTLIEGFLSLGIFQGTVEEILRDGISCAFMAHGLGHSLGLDVHDSRQYLKAEHTVIPPEAKAVSPKLFTYLRIRQPLQEGMVVTVEPGCYFPPQLMEESGVWTSSFVHQERLKEYVQVGGVRIEDCVLVTATGYDNLTTVGRDREWVEGVCSGAL